MCLRLPYYYAGSRPVGTSSSLARGSLRPALRELQAAALHGLLCRHCHAVLVSDGAITKLPPLPLPSAAGEQLMEHWFCHAHSAGGDAPGSGAAQDNASGCKSHHHGLACMQEMVGEAASSEGIAARNGRFASTALKLTPLCVNASSCGRCAGVCWGRLTYYFRLPISSQVRF